ncbi:unnamed protein product [Dovyalis caffra]|uniref:Uncharacterized protein n=1 Tax=Dovyalis caffra TaxID=77055 RepID=A0AAV1RY57_9ROSI|nr:unnamed protein product [Dovyalis caffra]
MDSLLCDPSRRSEDPDKNVAYIRQHHHNEYMPSTTPDLLSTARKPNVPQNRQTRITGHPSGITQLQRVGVGLVLSAISMAVAGLVEVKRRKQSLKDLHHPISLFWLSFQYGIFGIADMFTLVGLLEFFYKEAPLSMKSLSTSFTYLSLSFGYFLSTVFVSLINVITKRVTPSKHGWLHGEFLDYNNLNLFYWFLAVLSCLNFLLYLYSASWYKYKSADRESTNKPRAKGSDDGLLLVKEENTTESCGAKANGEESTEEKVAKRSVGEESTQEKEMVTINSTDAEAKVPSSEQSNEAKQD